jgi:hypothetical protein
MATRITRHSSARTARRIIKTFALLNNHVKLLHADERKFACDICQFRFPTNTVMKEHKRRLHSGKKFVCNLCPKNFATASELKTHQLSHNEDKNFECDICHKKFKHPNGIDRHKRRVHDGERSYVCVSCDLAFRSADEFIHHTQSKHESNFYKCDGCLLKFRSEIALRSHRWSIHQKIDKECEHCHRHFTSRLAFRYHTAPSKRVCPECNVDCLCIAKKREHLDSVHPPECKECRRSFKSRAGFASHTYRTHKIFECPLCDVKLQYNEMRAHRFGRNAAHPHFFCSLCKRHLNGQKKAHDQLLHTRCRFCSLEYSSIDEVFVCEKSHGRVRQSLEDALKDFDENMCEMSGSGLFQEMKQKPGEFMLRAAIVSTANGNFSINDDEKSNIDEEKIFDSSDSDIKLLGNSVAAFTRANLTQSVLEKHEPGKVTKSTRPPAYYVYEKKLQDGLERLNVRRIPDHHFGHLATSCYGHDSLDKIFRNCQYNLTMISAELNTKEMLSLEKWGLNEVSVMSATSEGKFSHLVREILCIHDTTSRHPLGQPLFIIEIFSFWRKDGTFELRIFLLPNVPLKKYFGFFELSCWQFETVFGKKLLTCATADPKVFINKSDHMREIKARHDTISTEQLRELVNLSRDALAMHPLIIDEEVIIDVEEQDDLLDEDDWDDWEEDDLLVVDDNNNKNQN